MSVKATIVKYEDSTDESQEFYSTIEFEYSGVAFIWVVEEVSLTGWEEFLKSIQDNKKCSIGGGGNSSWSCSFKGGKESKIIMSYSISGDGGDSSLQFAMAPEFMETIIVEVISAIKRTYNL